MTGFLRFLFIAGFLILGTACTKVTPEVSALKLFLSSTAIPVASFLTSSSSLSATNSGSNDVSVQLSSPALMPVTITATASGSAVSGVNYTGTFSVVIPAGSTTGSFPLTTIDTLEYAGSTNLVLTLDPPVGATLGSPMVHTATIYKDHLSTFSVAGVTGGSDISSDAYLNTTTFPTISWGFSNGASSYDVTVFEADNTTVACATQNVAAPSTAFTFSGCSLTVGNHYSATVIAKTSSGTNSASASNGPYDFLVNSPPTAGVFSTFNVPSNGSLSLNPLSGGSPSAGCGIAGCTLSVQSVGTGTIGTLSLTANTVTYTPSGPLGPDSFTYVIADDRGGTVTGTINLKVRSPSTWTGAGPNANWSTAANWLNGSPPTSSDDAVFDDLCMTNCSPMISSAVTVKGLTMTPAYTGTIAQNATLNVSGSTGFTISGGTFSGGSAALNINGGGSFSQDGGTFNGGAQNIPINGNFTQTSGTFTATTGTMTVVGNFNASGGTFSANNGTIYLTNGTNLNLGGRTYKHLSFGGTSITKTMSGGDPVIMGNLTFGCNTCTYNGANFLAYGDVTANSTSVSKGTSVVAVLGNASGQTISSTGTGTLPNLVISAGTNAVTLGSVGVAGNYIYTSSGTFTTTGYTLTLGLGSPTNFNPTVTPGPLSYYNVVFKGPGAFDLSGSTMQIQGSLTLTNLVSGSRINNGTLNVRGNATATSSYATGNGLVKLVGSAGQTLSTSSGFFPNLEIASTGGSVLFTSNVQVGGDYIYTSGSVSPSYPLILGVTGVLAGQITNMNPYVIPGAISYPYGVQFASVGSQAFNLNGGILYTSDLSINGSSGMSVHSGQINADGNVILSNLGAASSATLVMSGSSPKTLTTSGTVNLPTIAIAKGGGTVTLANAFTFAGTGQTMAISSGTLNMSGYDLTLKALTMSSGTTVSLSGGILKVNGTTIFPGPFGSGNINF